MEQPTDGDARFLALDRRCPRLGGPVTLAYCLASGEAPLPCGKIIDCWWERFPVVPFLEARFTPAEMARLGAGPPVTKIVQIAELVAQARDRLIGGNTIP